MVEKNRGLTGTLSLQGIAVTVRLGVFPFERVEPRKIKLDLKWTGEILAGGVAAVDYSQVCKVLQSTLEPEYLYLEELARDTMIILRRRWSGNWIVSVHKDHPPTDPPLERATVTIGE